jgi:hypothetical protein
MKKKSELFFDIHELGGGKMDDRLLLTLPNIGRQGFVDKFGGNSTRAPNNTD